MICDLMSFFQLLGLGLSTMAESPKKKIPLIPSFGKVQTPLYKHPLII